MTNPNQRSVMKFYRKSFWKVVAILALGVPQPATAESRGTFYALLVDPQGSERSNDSGWGFGAGVAMPLISTREIIKLSAGFDMGNLEFETHDPSLVTGFATAHDYQRVFGGAEIGRRLDARIRPHFGANVAALRQDVQTLFSDVSSGEQFVGRSDTSTRLGYDLTAGLDVGITRETGLEVGVRYLDGFELKVPEDDGSFSKTRPEYLQYYFGLTRRFAWPKGQ
jgi:opacity protein-like surface antigen